MRAWLASVLFMVVACSDSGKVQEDDSAPSTPDVTTQACGTGYETCSGACVATKRDPQNCGGCGKACKEGEVCVQGGCALQCGGGATKCAGTCVSTKSDPQNCGQCGNKCSAGEVCSAGKCALTCQQGLTDCSGACVELGSDNDHCGMCGNVCAAGKKCEGGKCVPTCQGGLTACGDKCVDLTRDAQNCGSCGNACGQGQFCSPPGDGGSACSLGCFGGTTKCGNACVDTSIDPQNCGGCGNSCSGTCFNGQCCPNNQLYCNGACRDTKTDKNHCGACNNACAGICNQGTCCGANDIVCNGKCANTQFDNNNCGGCGNVCPNNNPFRNMGTCGTRRLHAELHPEPDAEQPVHRVADVPGFAERQLQLDHHPRLERQHRRHLHRRGREHALPGAQEQPDRERPQLRRPELAHGLVRVGLGDQRERRYLRLLERLYREAVHREHELGRHQRAHVQRAEPDPHRHLPVTLSLALLGCTPAATPSLEVSAIDAALPVAPTVTVTASAPTATASASSPASPQCPPTFGGGPQPTCAASDNPGECRYPEGVCRCVDEPHCGGAYPPPMPPHWLCERPKPPCPPAGSPCKPGDHCSNNRCGYGPVLQCKNGVYVLTLVPPPP